MTRRLTLLPPTLLCLAVVTVGCGTNSDTIPLGSNLNTTAETAATTTGSTTSTGDPGEGMVDPKVMLRSVVQLLRTAATNPGGDNFNIAKDYLNQYFAGVRPADFALSEAMRSYLTEKLPTALEGVLDNLNLPAEARAQLNQRVEFNTAQIIPGLETPTFTFRDSRHIEDCLLLNTLARRVGGDGEDLVRAQRLFDWTIRQVQLVPAGGLAPPGTSLPQAAARPYDVLLRAMATEQGAWAERSWVFLALCRQLGLDAGLLRIPTPAPTSETEAPSSKFQVWAVAVLVEGVPYLFDCRLGLPIPSSDGRSVATLEQAATDPTVLDQLDLPGQPYLVHQADLAGSGKLVIWLDSTLELLSPRMRQLQRDLAGRDRMVLFEDVAEQDAAFAKAFGDRFGGTELWPLPIEVETRLFLDPTFVESTQYTLQFFDSNLPLLPARLGQLRGDLAAAVQSYAAFRYAEKPVMNDGKTPIPPAFQQVLDFYATYYLGLAKLDQGELDRAAGFFRQTLKQVEDYEVAVQNIPEERRVDPYFILYRWGALTNLGLIAEALGDQARAVQDYAIKQPTGQGHGNLLRARMLLWPSSFAAPVAP